MQSKKLKVLVFGGTGSQARPSVIHLLLNGHEPYVLTRTASNAEDLVSKGAKVALADLGDREALKKVIQDMDAIAFLIPAFLEDSVDAKKSALDCFDLAKAAGIRILVWNLSGVVQDESTGDYRPELIRYLKKIQLPHILFEPTTYMENWLGPWTADYIKEKNLVSYPQKNVKRVGWIASDDMGKLVACAIERPYLADQNFKVSGIEAPTGDELAQIFSDVLKRPMKYYTLPPDEMAAVLEKAYGPGAGAEIVEMYRREQADPKQAGKFHDMKPILEKLPVKMTTVKEWIQKHADSFT